MTICFLLTEASNTNLSISAKVTRESKYYFLRCEIIQTCDVKHVYVHVFCLFESDIGEENNSIISLLEPLQKELYTRIRLSTY